MPTMQAAGKLLQRLLPVWEPEYPPGALALEEAFETLQNYHSRASWKSCAAWTLAVLLLACFVFLQNAPPLRLVLTFVSIIVFGYTFCAIWPWQSAVPHFHYTPRMPRDVVSIYFHRGSRGIMVRPAIDVWLTGVTVSDVCYCFLRQMLTRKVKISAAILSACLFGFVTFQLLIWEFRPGWLLSGLLLVVPQGIICYRFLLGFRTFLFTWGPVDELGWAWKALAKGTPKGRWIMRLLVWTIAVAVVAVPVIPLSIQGIASLLRQLVASSFAYLLPYSLVLSITMVLFAFLFHRASKYRYKKSYAVCERYYDDAHRALAEGLPTGGVKE